MPELNVSVIRHMSDITPDQWNALSGENPFASHRWFQFGETVLAEDVPFYILVSSHGELVARAAFWLIRHEPLPVPGKMVRSVMAAAFRRWPLLMCRTPLADVSGLVLPTDQPLRNAALKVISRTAHEIGRQNGVSFTAFDYLAPDEFTLDNYPIIDISEPSSRLFLHWNTFDEYVKQLGSSARKDYNRHRNRAAELQIVVHARDKVTNIDRAVELIRNVEQHHNMPPNVNIRRMLENAHKADSTWLSAEMDGRMVGCGLVIGDGTHRILTCLGLDYEVKYVYFQMAYSAIRAAIEAKAKVLRGGGGAYEFKERLGFERVSNGQIAVVSNNRAFVHFVRRLAG